MDVLLTVRKFCATLGVIECIVASKRRAREGGLEGVASKLANSSEQNECRIGSARANCSVLGGGVTRWTAGVVAIWLASFPGIADARTDCEAVPRGPERTDCHLALSQFYRAQSDLAAAKARAQSDAAWYRAIAGTGPPRQKPRWRR
jgi:hypothetical protein